MSRKWALPLVLLGVLLAPTVAMAATGSFSSASSTTALTATNSSTGKAVNATSNSGSAGVFTRNATTGTTPALSVVGRSGSTNGTALKALASSTADVVTNGIWGQSNAAQGRGVFGSATGGMAAGVWGRNPNAYGLVGEGFYGVTGFAGTPGDGTLAIYSTGDLGLDGHLSTNGDVAGQCTIIAEAVSATCNFSAPYPVWDVVHVVVTPTSNPGAFYWVTNQTDSDTQATTGFTITLASAPAGDVTFNYHAIARFDAGVASLSASSLRLGR